MTPFFTILTNYGKTALAQALAAQQPLKIPHMAVGDGDGEYYEPVEEQTNLRNERWRGDLNDLRTDEEIQGQVIAEAIIPHDIEGGDWTAREIGLFDAKGGLVAVGKYPETYIPSALSGAKSQVYINIIIKVDNAAAVELIVNHDTVLASKLHVYKAINDVKADFASSDGANGIGYGESTVKDIIGIHYVYLEQFGFKSGDDVTDLIQNIHLLYPNASISCRRGSEMLISKTTKLLGNRTYYFPECKIIWTGEK
ncbi:MAG: phage tail protein, partial [Providencia heimbachae]|nr:phage tail protein [Providencia heimbachae]